MYIHNGYGNGRQCLCYMGPGVGGADCLQRKSAMRSLAVALLSFYLAVEVVLGVRECRFNSQ